MHPKAPLKILAIVLILIAILPLSACNVSGTKMEFSFNTSAPANSSDEKIIYLNNDMDKLELRAELKMDSGYATIQMLNGSDDELVWSGNYQDDSNFIIGLYDVKAKEEYILKIEALQSKEVSFIVTSDNRLVKDKEKPEKYIIEKNNNSVSAEFRK